MMRLEDDLTYKAILGYIYEKGRGYPDEIARKLNFTRQAADYRLKRLTIENYIKKKIDQDGRVYYILTEKAYKILKVRKKASKEEIYKIVKYIPLAPIALGLIGLGKYVAEANFTRGIITFLLWSVLGIITYIILKEIFGK